MSKVIKRILFSECCNWKIKKEIYHETKRYFSIIGLKKEESETILIRQEEIGILGVISYSDKNENFFLILLKEEPGNIPLSQWAPTVQATKSNYEQVHGGKATPYLDVFMNESDVDILASEQGDKFYNKFNRNTIRFTPQMLVPFNDAYKWVSTKELKENLRKNYYINTDLRSVIATSKWTFYADYEESIFLGAQLPLSLNKSFNRSFHTLRPNVIKEALERLKGNNKNIEENWELVDIENLRKFVETKKCVFQESDNF